MDTTLQNLIKHGMTEDKIVDFIQSDATRDMFLPNLGHNNALFLAINRNLIQVVKTILELHRTYPEWINLNHQNFLGNHALMVALKAEANEISNLLIDYYIKNPHAFDINLVNHQKESSLHLLMTYPNNHSVLLLEKMLSIKELNINSQDYAGQNAFCAMIDSYKTQEKKERIESIFKLIEHIIAYNQKQTGKDFELNATTELGLNAFLNACRKDEKIVEKLLSYESIFNLRQETQNGQNALSFASFDTLKVLVKNPAFRDLDYLVKSQKLIYLEENLKLIEQVKVEVEQEYLNQQITEKNLDKKKVKI